MNNLSSSPLLMATSVAFVSFKDLMVTCSCDLDLAGLGVDQSSEPHLSLMEKLTFPPLVCCAQLLQAQAPVWASQAVGVSVASGGRAGPATGGHYGDYSSSVTSSKGYLL